jgi:hypothetical protein
MVIDESADVCFAPLRKHAATGDLGAIDSECATTYKIRFF